MGLKQDIQAIWDGPGTYEEKKNAEISLKSQRLVEFLQGKLPFSFNQTAYVGSLGAEVTVRWTVHGAALVDDPQGFSMIRFVASCVRRPNNAVIIAADGPQNPMHIVNPLYEVIDSEVDNPNYNPGDPTSPTKLVTLREDFQAAIEKMLSQQLRHA